MKLSAIVALLSSSIAVATVLEKRQECFQDDCIRAINGTRRGQSHPATGTANCVQFMTSTVLIDPTITTTTITARATLTEDLPCPTSSGNSSIFLSLPTAAAKRAMVGKHKARQAATTTLETTHGPIPFYATSACPSEGYSSACSCLGISSAIVTSSGVIITRTTTTTITDTIIGSCTTASPTNTTVTSQPPPTSTFNITFTLNSTTTTTVITLTSSDVTGTGTGTEIGTTAISTTQSVTPPFRNSTTQSGTSSFISGTGIETSFNATTTAVPTNTTLTSGIPTPTSSCSNSSFIQDCDGTCVDLRTDTANCGSCGNVCGVGQDCTNGVCTRQACDSSCGAVRPCGPPDSTCICGLETGGGGVCFDSVGSCDDYPRCTDTPDCALGFVCVTQNCCGEGKCVSTAGCLDDGATSLGRLRTPNLGPGATIFGGLYREV